MSSILETRDDCQTNASNNSFPIAVESLRFPLDSSMHIVFTGYYNGFGIEVRSVDEMALLYHMGCFGKGSASRSKPKAPHSDGSPSIIRRRQFLKRNYWYKKFGNSKEKSESDLLLIEIDSLTAKVIRDGERQLNTNVIDLVSSEEENSGEDSDADKSNTANYRVTNEQDIAVVVPNSDSEEDNYFANLKPQYCINKITIQEKLMLTLQEAFFLTYGLGCLQVVNANKVLSIQQCWELFKQTDKHFISKYVVYHYFRAKGYVVKPGIKFGGDFLLYREGPGIKHADYIVIIKQEEENFDWTSICCQVRMATTTAKEVLIAEIVKLSENEDLLTSPEGLRFYSIRKILLTRKIPLEVNENDE